MASLLEEKDAIREVLSEYCFALDGGHFAAMAALFTEDGTWSTAFGAATGRPAIEALVRKLHSRRPAGPEHRGVHLVSNLVIKIDGDTARVLSNWVVAQNSPSGPIVSAAGGYEDHLVKMGESWLFRSRVIDRFIAADLHPEALT